MQILMSVILTSVLSGCSFSVEYGFHISRWIQGKRIEMVFDYSLISVFFLLSFLSVGSEIKHTELTPHHHKLIFAGSDGLCMKNSLEHTIFGLACASPLLSLFLWTDGVMNSKSHCIRIVHNEYRSIVHIHCSWCNSRYWMYILYEDQSWISAASKGGGIEEENVLYETDQLYFVSFTIFECQF